MSGENDQPKPPTDLVFTRIVLGLFAALIIFAVVSHQQKKAAKKKADAEYNQIYIEEYKLFADCELGVKSQLKFPHSYRLTNKSVYGGETGLVIIHYVAPNDFDTMIDGTFQCNFKRDPDSTENPAPFYLSGVLHNGRKFSVAEVAGLQVEIVQAWLNMR